PTSLAPPRASCQVGLWQASTPTHQNNTATVLARQRSRRRYAAQRGNGRIVPFARRAPADLSPRRFVAGSPVEERGFELVVPRRAAGRATPNAPTRCARAPCRPVSDPSA